MAYEVPQPYVWDESFRVVYDILDAEHRAIFEAICDCSKNRSSPAHIMRLNKITEDHFINEEDMMQKAKYPGYTTHKQTHDDFLAKIRRLKVPLSDASLSWTKQWLVGHIKGIDFKYKGKL